MKPLEGALRVITNTANATTAAAGAVGGAAVDGVIGGVQGTAQGIRTGLSNGSHSTPAAALTLAALGAAGLVEWPVLLTVGGAALVIHQVTKNGQSSAESAAPANESPAKQATARKAASRRGTSPRQS